MWDIIIGAAVMMIGVIVGSSITIAKDRKHG